MWRHHPVRPPPPIGAFQLAADGLRLLVKLQPVQRERPAQQVSARSLECFPVALLHRDGCLDIEPVHHGAQLFKAEHLAQAR